MVNLASRHGALVLAGNTLAHNQVADSEIQELARILRNCKVPVLLLPGQLDPYSPDSPYRNRNLFGGSIHILQENVPMELEDCKFFSAPWKNPNTFSSPKIPGRTSDCANVLVACCSNHEALPQWGDFDQITLGGSMQPAQEGTTSWSGSIEPLSFDDQVGKVFFTTVGPNLQTVYQSRSVGQSRWRLFQESVKDFDALNTRLESLENPQDTVVSIRLRGSVSESRSLEISQRLEILRARFLGYTVDDATQLQLDAEEDAYDNRLLHLIRENLQGNTDMRDAVLLLRRLANQHVQSESS